MAERYHKLSLIRVSPDRFRGGRVGIWKCDCGTEKAIPFGRVRSGQAKSCGCLRLKHGLASRSSDRSAEYVAWQAMRARCAATKGRDYDAYAARDIGVCERWSEFNNFLNDMGEKPTPSHSLGRINNDLGYGPGNCRWETPTQQLRNTRKSMIWKIKGEVFESCRDAAEHFSVDHRTVRYWVKTRGDCDAIARY